MQLHQTSLAIGFNPLSKKEVDEAKTKYIQAKKEGRNILSMDTRSPLARFPLNDGGFIIDSSPVAEGSIAVHFIDGSGDQRIVWDMRDKAQIKECAIKFKEYVDKGWKPYAINKDGSRGRRIFSFSASSEEIIFEDKTTREKLSKFSEKFKEIKVLPRTYPG